VPQDELRLFADPPAEFRFAPFWFLNHRLTDEELIRQIDELYAAGFGGFILHARHGRLTPYMSEEWLDRMETCCRRAQELGMWAWLYDEDNWPSGPAGGRVTQEHPEFRMSQLYLSGQWRARSGQELNVPVDQGDGLLYVLAVPGGEGRDERTMAGIVEITEHVQDGRLCWQAPDGRWLVLAFSRSVYRGTFFGHYLDLLNPRAVAAFMDATHRKYERRLKPYFGKGCKGIFTDEPSSFYSNRPDAIQWTPALAEAFEKATGLPFIQALAALFLHFGETTLRIRCQFMQLVTELYVDSFYKPIHQWCRRNKLLSIGHVNQEDRLRSILRMHGDYFAVTEWMDYAGLDALRDSRWSKPGYENNMVAAKMASSAGHLLQKPRVMNESWGLAGGWTANLEMLKKLGDFHVALGVNYFMPHAVYYSLEGFRKWECPPDEFYHEPYWPYYRVFADYLARLSALFADGEHVAPVAVLIPTHTGWSLQAPMAESKAYASAEENRRAEELHKLEHTFEAVSEELIRGRYDFDYVTEELLQKAEVVDGTLTLRGKARKVLERFRVLVLPRVTVLSENTLPVIEKFAASGGIVCFVEVLPEASVEKGMDRQVAEWSHALLERHRDMVIIAELGARDFVRQLAQLLEPDCLVPENRDVIALRYRRGNRDFYFICNTSEETDYPQLSVRLSGCGRAYELDAETGRVHELEARQQGDRVTLALDLPRMGSRVVMLSPKSEQAEPARPRLLPVTRKVLALPKTWAFEPAGGNYLPLSDWEFSSEGYDMGAEWLGYRIVYRTVFQVAEKPRWARLLLDGVLRQELHGGLRRKPVTVTLNGQEVGGFEPSTHYDRLCFEAEVTDLLRPGRNELAVSGRGGMGEVVHLDQAQYLVGDFSLSWRGRRWVVSAPRRELKVGSWTEQGYPYFSGVGIYRASFEAPRKLPEGRLLLRFGKVGDLVEVKLNGESLRVLAWPPYHVDVTGKLRKGRNELELLIANTLHNLFRRDRRPSGLLTSVELAVAEP